MAVNKFMNIGKVRVPQQRRSIEIKRKIKLAAQTLFSEKGYHNTSSNEIVRAAGVSIGAFYSYFPNKKSLFIELLHEYNQNIVAQVENSFIQTENPRRIIEQYIYSVLNSHNYSPEFHSEILVMSYSDEQIRDITTHYENNMIGQIEQLLKNNKSMLKITRFTDAAYLIFKSVEEVIHGIKVFKRPCDEATLIHELTEMICSYILQ